MDYLTSVATISRILDQRRTQGDMKADLVEDTVRRILATAPSLVGNVPGSEGYVGIFDRGHPQRFQFVYVNFYGRVDFELPRGQIKEYEALGYAKWLDNLKEDHHRAAVDLEDAISVLVAVELATRARTFTENGSRIRHTTD
jgi:hypothetical protein